MKLLDFFQISEALDSSYNYELKNGGYYFTTDTGAEYKVMLTGTKKVEVSFVTRDKDGQVKDTITGTGDSRKVFGTVINIVKEYVNSNNPEILVFSASNAEPSRIRLYNALATQASRVLSGYTFAKTLKLSNVTTFYLTRDNIKVPKVDIAKNTAGKALDAVFEDDRDYEIRNLKKLDEILTKLVKMVIEGQKRDSKYYGMVAAAVLDPDNNLVARLNFPGKDGRRIHAERAAMAAYKKEYGKIPEGSIVITTLSPCSDHMDEREGVSCTELINHSPVHKVYCGYMDPSQHDFHRREFTLQETNNSDLRKVCKSLADTFLKNTDEMFDIGMGQASHEKNEIHEETDNKIVYHVTPTKNIKSIMQNGLIVQMGNRSSKIPGEINGIFVFSTKDEAEDAVANWLGDEFEEDEDLALLAIDSQGLKKQSGAGYEEIILSNIEPGRIKVLNYAFESFDKYRKQESLTESINVDQFKEILKKFLPFAKKIIKLDRMPTIVLKKTLSTDNQPTMGRFHNNSYTLELAIANRQPVDILRTLAHELTHAKQHLEHVDIDPTTGSKDENEANVVAGIVMRHFNKEYPEYLSFQPLEESKSNGRKRIR